MRISRLPASSVVCSLILFAVSIGACGRHGSSPSAKSFETNAQTAEFAITYDVRYRLNDSADTKEAVLRTFHLDGATKLELSLVSASGQSTRSSWMLKGNGTEIACGLPSMQADDTICEQSDQPPRVERRFLGVTEFTSEGSAVTGVHTDTIAGLTATCFDMKPTATYASWTQCFDRDGARLSLNGGGASLLLGFFFTKLQAFGLETSISTPIAVDSVTLTATERRVPATEDFATHEPIATALIGCKFGRDDVARDVSEACAHSLTTLAFQFPRNLAGYREPEIQIARGAAGEHVKVIYADRSGQNLMTLEAEPVRAGVVPSTGVPVLVGSRSIRLKNNGQGRTAFWADGAIQYRLTALDPAFDARTIDARILGFIAVLP